MAGSPAGGAGGARELRRLAQPAHADLLELLERDEEPLQRGVAPGVCRLSLPAGAGEPAADGPFRAWTDGDSGASRGGAQLFVPASPRPGACVLFVHGGAFVTHGPLEAGYDSLCSRLAAQSGVMVLCPDHPLAGDGTHRAPEIMEQLHRDSRWLLRSDPATGAKWDSLPDLVLAGDSSGGNQALALLLRAAHNDPELLGAVRGVLAISPWLDLTCGSHTYVSNEFAAASCTGDVCFRDPAAETRRSFRDDYAMSYVGEAAMLRDPLYSPYWLGRCLPGEHAELRQRLRASRVPLWLCVGAAETLAGEVLDFAQRMRETLPVETWLHEGMFHDWVMYDTKHAFPSKDVAMRNMADFIRRVLDSPVKLNAGIHYYIDEW